MDTQSYQQTTYESCLAVCLLLLTRIQPLPIVELAIWRAGWRRNFLMGQTKYFTKKYRKELIIYTENKSYAKELFLKSNATTQITPQVINLKLINYHLKTQCVIVYVDNIYLTSPVHAPHFILVLSKAKNGYLISDPWDGKIKHVSQKTLKQAVESLKNYLRYSPVLIIEKV